MESPLLKSALSFIRFLVEDRKRNWRCGKCDQEQMMLEGKEVGEIIPEHFRTCKKRIN